MGVSQAIVFNKYFHGLGGGERSTLAYARALQDCGYDPLVISTHPLPEPARIEATFGSEFSGIHLRYVEERELETTLRRESPAVFVNHSFLDFTPNPAPIGIYSQMFPTKRITRGNARKEMKALQSYRMILNNSSFTKRYTDLLWEYPARRSHVLHPPVGRGTIAAAEGLLREGVAKEKLIVGIGRFNLFPTNKNQKLILRAFLEARSRYPELEDWRLLLIGNKNPDPESEAYHDECRELVRQAGGNVELQSELSNEELATALSKAFGYVHATGAYLLPGEEPFRCEHLGLSIVEAMANGCIPLVYARGGIYDILDVAKAGIPYATHEGFVDGFGELAGLWRNPETERMQHDLAEMALQLGYERFAGKVKEFIQDAGGR